ncbi:3652_t:CDS:2 [Ambispora gerdemannii]|uniref:DNA-directed RNA polymerase III subunit RPC6 n=1 Tax=Ambispora gerdemannii TaxID=144530 RepID=A0A9N8ZKG2_9GLOM|nr:3652_t:CDS:2 [Ambispora gerdemannii]
MSSQRPNKTSQKLVEKSNFTPMELKVYQFINNNQISGESAETVVGSLNIKMKDAVEIINKLSRSGLIEMRVQPDNTITYYATNVRDIQDETDFDNDEKLVLYHIKTAGNEGIWTKHIKTNTGLHQSVITRSLKNLESKGIIKAIKSIKHPTRKIYMLSHLTPSEDISGGPWFSDQKLDVDFVESLTEAVYRFILSRSFPKGNPDAVYCTFHPSYPTATQIHRFITESKISDVELELANINSLLDLLIFDGKVERKITVSDAALYDLMEEDESSGEIVYKAIRDHKSRGNALTDVPCGKYGGVVSPSSCVYFRKWLLDY